MYVAPAHRTGTPGGDMVFGRSSAVGPAQGAELEGRIGGAAGGVLVLAWAALGPHGASAAEADADVGARVVGEVVVTGAREVRLDETTATGSRLGLVARETPAVVDVLTQERFLERGLRTSNEALNTAPGVLAVDAGGAPGTYSMRGFSGGSVSVNYDGVHQPSTMITRNFDTFAFERIEVLKGPASVLFGEGAMGGAVNLVPKKPILRTRQFLALGQYGSFDTFRAALDANLPLGDKAAARGVFSYAGSNGYIDDTLSRTKTANLGLTYRPTERLDLFFAAELFNNDNGRTYWGAPLVAATVARDPSDAVRTAGGFVLDRALKRTTFQYLDGQVRSRSHWLRSVVNWHVADGWKLTNDLSYNYSNRLWRDAESYVYQPPTGQVNRQPIFINNVLDFWNERLSVSYDGQVAGRRNRFTAGFEHTENDHLSRRRFGANTPVDPYSLVRGTFPAITPANFPGAGNFADVGADIRIDALFAEDAFNLTDDWLLVGGLRYEKIRLDRDTHDYNLGADSGFVRRYRPTSYRIGTVYSLLPKTQVYAQYAKAAAPVGTLVLLNQSNAGFNLTKGTSREIGVKSSFWNDRVEVTLAAYHIRQTDIITRDPVNPNIQIQGGTQSSRGVEVSGTAQLSRQLRLDGNMAFVDAQFDELIEAGGLDRAGNSPTHVPAQVYNLFVSYDLDGAPIRLTAGLHRANHIFGDNANLVRAKGYTVFDASMTYQLEVGDITLRARNIGNELYAEWATASQAYLGAPRSFDVTFRTRF